MPSPPLSWGPGVAGPISGLPTDLLPAGERRAPAPSPVLHRPTAVEMHIGCTGEGFARARGFTRDTLRRWDLDHCADDAVLVLTELASNAVAHAVPRALGGDQDVRLGLALGPTHLTLTVSDPADAPPVCRPPDGYALEEHGRGLCLVDALSDEWGWTPRPPAGKTVWARLSTRSHLPPI
ncbi:ATP-binding protein [Streptomyces sp. DH24]|uniref:ATP-binding protein n=1 Tax=Streptomyces sp. DH24 TaxID=3040123 RepID=UPI0024423991|nr:ATP-binding protein [Streptomyces sp. DH24]MDG9720421.1 ATP-binding protein [Streptomyces sp. DH24]